MLGAVCKGVAELYTHRIEEAPGLVFVTPSDDLAFINDILVVVDVAAAVFGFAGSELYFIGAIIRRCVNAECYAVQRVRAVTAFDFVNDV